MRNNHNCIGEQVLEKIKKYLQEEVDTTELNEDTMQSIEDGILVGRKELSESLLNEIKKWED
tara:strand:- start:453 stop:638 length:186 start_codon:yes stop_codon:yes gene_type:complete